jgi:hypothetical protein
MSRTENLDPSPQSDGEPPAGSHQKAKATQTSQVDNRSASFHNAGDVYNAPVSHQTVIQDSSVTYDVDKRDVEGLERLSRFIIDLMGERNVKIWMVITFLLGGGSVFSSVQNPELLGPVSPYPLYFGVALLTMGAVLFGALQYKYESRCVKCNTFYAMKETGEPKVREVEVQGGVRRTTARTYRCAKCSHVMTKKSNELVEDDP